MVERRMSRQPCACGSPGMTAARLLWRWAMLAVCFLTSGCGGFKVGARSRTVRADDGWALTTYQLEGPRGLGSGGHVRANVFYVQGSSDRSALRVMGQLAGFVMMDMRVVLVERRGVLSDGSVDEAVARRFATKQSRTEDMLAAMRAYLADAPSGTPVILVGGSEGGDVAAAVAVREPRVTHLLLIGTGGGWSQADEIRHYVRARGSYLGVKSVAEVDAKLEEIRARPGSEEMWLGHSFRRWSSYLWSPPVADLERLEIPILLAHGAKDDSVPVESARAARDAMAARGKRNLRYVEYPTFDHSFRDVDRRQSGLPLLELDVVRWLSENGVLDGAERKRFEDRVRDNHPEWF